MNGRHRWVVGILAGVVLVVGITVLVVTTVKGYLGRAERRLTEGAHTIEWFSHQHVGADRELLAALAAVLAPEPGPEQQGLAPAVSGLVAAEPRILQLARVSPDGRVALLVPVGWEAADDEELVRRVIDTGRSGLTPDGLTGVFTSVLHGNCLGMLRRVPGPQGRDGQLVIVYSLDRWADYLRQHLGLTGLRAVIRGSSGEVLAGDPSWPTDGFRASVPLSSLGRHLTLELALPRLESQRAIETLGSIAWALSMTLVGSLGFLLRQRRAERRAAEEAATRSAELRAVFSSLGEGVLVLGLDGTVQSSNNAAQGILGMTAGQLKGRHLRAWQGELETDDGQTLDLDAPCVHDALNSGSPRDFVVGMRHRNEHVIWLAGHMQPLVRGKDSRPEGVVVSFSDVSWQREAERRLRESEQRFRELVQSVDAVVWEADRDEQQAEGLRFTFVSERADELLGYPSRRWLDEPGFWSSRLHSEDRDAALAERAARVAAGESYELDYRLQAADGHYVYLHDAVRVTTDAHGRTLRLSGVLIDVTRARELELALKAASQDWRATFDALDIALLVLDSSLRIRRLNRPAMELLGNDGKTCLGRVPWDVVTHEPWITARAVAAAPQGATPRQVRDAEGRVWYVHCEPLPPSKENLGALILTLRDDTRLFELQESVRLAETWTAMGTLVAGVAHEVRNPLFAISANIDALGAVLRGGNQVAHLLKALRQERDRLNRLMDDLLLYGHAGSRAEMRVSPLGAVLQAALAHCAPLAATHGLHIVLHGDERPSPVRMHRDRLEEVFVNLIENACYHSPKGSEIHIDLDHSHDTDGQRLVCRVRDSGTGFPIEALPRVFEPFFTRRKGGTGLGLAIVQRLVMEHGGHVSAANGPGGGAVVTVVLPLAPGAS